MTPVEVRNAITSRYLTEFDGQFPIAVDNKKFDPPNPLSKWARVNVQFNDGNQSSLGKIGNRRFTKLGLLFVQIFTPINKGTDENDSLANSSANLFDGVRIQDLWLYNGRIKTIGSADEYYQQNVIVEFEFEEIR